MKKYIPWELIIPHLKHELSEADESRFQEWVTQDTNKHLFEELEAVWEEIRAEASTYVPDTSFYWKEMEIRMHRNKAVEKGRISLRTFRLAAAAAAVLLVIASSLTYLIGSKQVERETNLLSYTALSGKSKLILPDSSIVWLNSGSSLQYAPTFQQKREVTLRGEALFEVKKDSRHPFVVSASDLKVKVYGTRFNVNSYARKENIMVTLFQGSVSIMADNKESFLHPGERAVLNKNNRTLNIAPADVVFESFWANDKVRFEAKPLSYIARYLEKWYNVEIDLDPSIPDSQAYTFTIQDESLEGILRIMSRINPIEHTFDSDNHVIIRQFKTSKKHSSQ